MIEYLKHLFGLCGEPHGLLYLLMTTGGITSVFIYLKSRFNQDG